GVEPGALVTRAVIDHQDLMGISQCGEAAAQGVRAVERDDDDGDALRLRRGVFGFGGQTAILSPKPGDLRLLTTFARNRAETQPGSSSSRPRETRSLLAFGGVGGGLP